MAKYKHMTLDERIGIQKGLKEKKSFIEIGTEIDRDASTVAKEIKSHLLVKETGTRSRPYNPCKHRYNCGRQENVCPQCINQSIVSTFLDKYSTNNHYPKLYNQKTSKTQNRINQKRKIHVDLTTTIAYNVNK